MKQYRPYSTIGLLALNVLLFLICTFTEDLIYNIGEISPASFWRDGEYYRIITSMFLHADIGHIANNMLLLFGLGLMMEEVMGHWWFLGSYLLTGLVGNVASLLYKISQNEWNVYSLGASGAVFGLEGILLAYAIVLPGKMRSASWEKILLVTAYSIYCGIRSTNIDNAAHIGGYVSGFLIGFIICMIQKRKEDKRRQDLIRQGWRRI